MQRAYTAYTSEATKTKRDSMTLDQWCAMRAHQSVQFDFWFKTLSLEILMLLYVRAIRECNFQLYVKSLTKVVSWMFALDRTLYSRWLPVHIRDMMLLSQKHPDVLEEVRAEKFLVHKTDNIFSAMAIDQCHEQNNVIIKGSGGVVCLTDNPPALRRWIVAGPEVAIMIAEFEDDQDQDHTKKTASITMNSIQKSKQHLPKMSGRYPQWLKKWAALF